MILDFAFSKGYDAEEIGNTLLDMVDPKRHIHPGIPYDFYDGYIVVIGESGVLPKPASRYACITLLLQKYHSVEIKQKYCVMDCTRLPPDGVHSQKTKH